jgi:hypothetical protein
MVLKSILFQAIYILYTLQRHKLEFTHNDFKSDNLMLERCQDPIMIVDAPRIWRINCWCVRLVLIDAETAAGALFKPSPLWSKMSKASRASFGMDFPFSPYTDLHLLCLELLHACKTWNASWKTSFLEFLEEWCIPLQYFNAPYITKDNRLNGIGRIALKQLGRSLDSMLVCPYFEELRIDA